MATVRDILDLLEGIAPLETQEEWDNAGLLAGDPASEVTRVLVALDLTLEVVEEATRLARSSSSPINPILFRGRKNLREDDAEGKLLAALIRARLAMIAMHTNFDSAEGGVNSALCERLGIRESSLGERHAHRLDRPHAPCRVPPPRGNEAGRRSARLRRGGSGHPPRGGAGRRGRRLRLHRAYCGADAYVTGEFSYHAALDCRGGAWPPSKPATRPRNGPRCACCAKVYKRR